MLKHEQLLEVEEVRFDDRLRFAEDVGEEEFDGGQVSAFCIQQQDVENVLEIALRDVV